MLQRRDEFRNIVFKNSSYEESLNVLHYKISSRKHIYLNLLELGRLESYVIRHFKKWQISTRKLYSLVRAKQFYVEEATTYTSG
jgi:hypothetical protein